MSAVRRVLPTMGRFLHEARIRRVPQAVLAYVALSWLTLQVGDILFAMLDLPAGSMHMLLTTLVLGFPIAIALAWMFDLTPTGLKREIVDAAAPESVAPHLAAMLAVAPGTVEGTLPTGVQRMLGAFHCLRTETDHGVLVCEFGSAHEALDAALYLLSEHGERVRAGMALGEVARAWGHFSGSAMHEVQAIARLAPAGGIAVTSALHYSALSSLHPELAALLQHRQGAAGAGEPHAWIAAAPQLAQLAHPQMPVGDAAPVADAWRGNGGLLFGFGLAIVAGLGLVLWLRAPAPATATREASMAILPFSSLSERQEDAYFAEGLADELHDALVAVEGLRLVSRRSAFALRDAGLDVRGLGERLNVATVLSASVRRAGNRLRVTAQLDDTHSGITLWTSSYDRELTDVFAVQRDIAGKVVEAMLGVLPHDGKRLDERLSVTASVSAFDHYLQGRQHLERRSSDSALAEAIASFEKALADDAGFGRAQAGICSAEIRRYERTRDGTALARAERACAQAAAATPELPVVNLALATLAATRGERERAAELYTLALGDPTVRTDAYLGLAELHGRMGHSELALEYIDRARDKDPGYWRVLMALGNLRQQRGELDAAAEAYLTAVTLAPDDANAPWNNLGTVRMAQRDYPRAEEAFRQSLRIEPTHSALSNLGTLRYWNRDYPAAADLYRQASASATADYRTWGNLADALAASGAPDGEVQATYRRAADGALGWIAVKTDDHAAVAAAAWYLANLGQPGRALALCEQAEQADGGNRHILFRAAQVHARTGDEAGARERLQRALAAGYPAMVIAASPLLAPLLAEEGGAPANDSGTAQGNAPPPTRGGT
jgi:TolB-like protein/Flp pilus assembly protein TadD